MKKSIPFIIMFILITVTAFIYKESKNIRVNSITEIFAVDIPENTVINSYFEDNGECKASFTIPAESIKCISNLLSGYEVYSQNYIFPFKNVKYGFYKYSVVENEIYIRNIYIFNEHDSRIEIYMERCVHTLR